MFNPSYVIGLPWHDFKASKGVEVWSIAVKLIAIQIMATPKDTTDISDPSRFKLEADGSFKRPAAIFRHSIEKRGAFEPEAGN